MENYVVLFHLKLEHEYYSDTFCRALTVIPTSATYRWIHRRGLLFRFNLNEGILIGRKEEMFDKDEQLELEIYSTDPHFLFFTEWEKRPDTLFHLTWDGKSNLIPLPSPAASFLPPDRIGKIGHIVISLTNVHSLKETTLTFKAKKYYWEYLLIPRTGTLQPETSKREIILNDTTEQIKFRDKKLLEFMGMQVWQYVSKQPISLKNKYDYQLRLLEETPYGQKVLMKRVAYPLPGQFANAERDLIRQVVYF
ncbi:hypothetical protein [Parabacteroides pacaensis]|uniref:hypothetical protein n=1 Tax=Parabacteroides pacaensis TaxID=2086575 RepID=UPI000D0ED44E|nr:hypothetical protein [Parabacteroides pacaensis]